MSEHRALIRLLGFDERPQDDTDAPWRAIFFAWIIGRWSPKTLERLLDRSVRPTGQARDKRSSSDTSR